MEWENLASVILVGVPPWIGIRILLEKLLDTLLEDYRDVIALQVQKDPMQYVAIPGGRIYIKLRTRRIFDILQRY